MPIPNQPLPPPSNNQGPQPKYPLPRVPQNKTQNKPQNNLNKSINVNDVRKITGGYVDKTSSPSLNQHIISLQERRVLPQVLFPKGGQITKDHIEKMIKDFEGHEKLSRNIRYKETYNLEEADRYKDYAGVLKDLMKKF